MARWAAFAGITVAVLVILLVLARTSQAVLTDASDRSDASAPSNAAGATDARASADTTVRSDATDATDANDDTHEPPGPGEARFVRYGPEPPSSSPPPEFSTRLLLANVAVSQGMLAAVLLVGAWFAQVPPDALGLVSADLGVQAALGVGFGLALAVANTVGAAAAGAFGFDPGEELRELLAPETPVDWVLLLVVLLPLIAGFEEFLFRAALVGAFSAGFGVSPWVLAVLSSVVFAFGHGAQGTAGIAVTGVLGFVLAAGFVLTGSLLVVVVAHYLVNAVEFVVYEGLGMEPLGR